ncbi:MAG: hypothetical protein R3C49_01705 [Planctomycetaceae bacterium]
MKDFGRLFSVVASLSGLTSTDHHEAFPASLHRTAPELAEKLAI